MAQDKKFEIEHKKYSMFFSEVQTVGKELTYNEWIEEELAKLFDEIPPASDGIIKLGKQMIDNPMDWVQGQYEFINKKNRDIAIWTCDGLMSIKISGFNCLSFADKSYISNCIKMSIANRLVNPV